MSTDREASQLAAMARTAYKLHDIVSSYARHPGSPSEGHLADAMEAALFTTSRLANAARTAVNSA